ncbi:MAG: hypothetical protein J6I84_02455 [Bacilli bacterium]|nr:hypothetical protein [Bacilli bacterium]
MNLSTRNNGNTLLHTYTGDKIPLTEILYRPIKISGFEFMDSVLHPGKKVLVMQVHYMSGDTPMVNVVFTESYPLIKTITGTEGYLPHYTKIVRKRNGYYNFVDLNDKEKLKIINL